MNKITAPYNFVPLNKHVYVPDWGDRVTQDIPFSDGEDGIIEVKWRNVSPLCIRDASDYKTEKGKDGEYNVYYSMNVKQDGKRLFFIPGSSLRGMLRNTLNTMSFGKMTQYDDKYFGHREFDTKPPKEKFGWLEKKGDVYTLYPCASSASKMLKEDVRRLYGAYDGTVKDEVVSTWDRNENIRKASKGIQGEKYESGDYFPIISEEYALYATGKMQGKLHELLIPIETKDGIELTKDEVTSFLTIHERTPGFEDGFKKNLLDKGLKIPVCYLVVKDKDRKAIGLSHLVRQPYKYGVKDLVEKEQKPVDGFDLSELIFGTVNGKCILKGRVQIGNAFSRVPLADSQLGPVVSGVLGEPKPSFYPFYLKQYEKQYTTYDDGGQISGRKLYRIHKCNDGVELPRGNGNEKTMSHMFPVPAGQEFIMRIVVHNLRKVEIGALLSAITYHHAPGTWHNIGSAKGYGYGKLKCESITLTHLQHTEEEYLRAYEYEISMFARKEYDEAWNQTKSMQTLGAIASEHDSESVRMMEMDKYTYYKKVFSKLEEKLQPLPTCLSDGDSDQIMQKARKRKRRELLRNFKQSHKEKYDKLVPWTSDNLHYVFAIDCWTDFLYELALNKCVVDDDKEMKAWLEDRQNRLVVVGGPVSASPNLIELIEKYKGNKWGAVQSIILKWQKKSDRKDLNEEEMNALAETIRRLYKNPDKKEKKDWGNQESNLWKQIAIFLGQDRADSLYKELHG